MCISTNHLWIDMGVYIFFVVAMSVWKSVGISVGGIGVSVVMYAWMSVEMAVDMSVERHVGMSVWMSVSMSV